MARIKTWEISDEFWNLVEPLIPIDLRNPNRVYKRKPGGGRKRKYSDRVFFSAIVYLSHSWFNRFLKLVPRREKTDRSYNALSALAAAMIVLNKVMVMYR